MSFVCELSGYHSAATWKKPKIHCINSDVRCHAMDGSDRRLTHLYHVDDVVRQPEQAERHHNSQDEFLAANLSAELGLSQAFQDQDVAGDNDRVRQDES